MPIQKITPCLWLEKEANKAAEYYISIFKDGEILSYRAYENAPEAGGSFDLATIRVLNMEFQLLAAGPMFKFNEAVSFSIRCADQAEVDYYWDSLTADGGKEGPCGWCADKYGLSWQIVPERYYELESHEDKSKQDYAFHALMKMKKIIIADLEEH